MIWNMLGRFLIILLVILSGPGAPFSLISLSMMCLMSSGVVISICWFSLVKRYGRSLVGCFLFLFVCYH